MDKNTDKNEIDTIVSILQDLEDLRIRLQALVAAFDRDHPALGAIYRREYERLRDSAAHVTNLKSIESLRNKL